MPKRPEKTLKYYIIKGYDKRGRVLNVYTIRAYSQKAATNRVKARNKHVVRTKVEHVFTPGRYVEWGRDPLSRRRKK